MTEPAQASAHRRGFLFRVPWRNIVGIVAIVLATTLITVKNLHGHTSSNEILNVSYDPTRELYATLDKAFVEQFRRQTGTTLEIKQSHGGSGRQVSDVIDGRQKANVVSLALVSDVELIDDYQQFVSLAAKRASWATAGSTMLQKLNTLFEKRRTGMKCDRFGAVE